MGPRDWFSLHGQLGEGRVIVQQAWSGEWEVERTLSPNSAPVGFWKVRAGTLDSVITTSFGVLVSEPVAVALEAACGAALRIVDAVIEHPQAKVASVYYCLLRPREGLWIAELSRPAPETPDVRYVRESPITVVVNRPVRAALEHGGFAGLTFGEPTFLMAGEAGRST